MVRTRHTRASLPNPTTTALPASPPLDPKAQKALEKLTIDAFDTLSGAKVERPPEEKTYRSRGGGYVWTSDTREEWVDRREGRRKRGRDSGVSATHNGDGNGDGNEGRKVKRRRVVAREDEDSEEAGEEQLPVTKLPQPPTKSASASTNKKPASALVNAKKRRRTLGDEEDSPSKPSPKRTKRRHTGRAEDEIPHQPTNSHRTQRASFTAHSPSSHTEQAAKRERIKDEMRKRGRQVDALPADQMRDPASPSTTTNRDMEALKQAVAHDKETLKLVDEARRANERFITLRREKRRVDARYKLLMEGRAQRESVAGGEGEGNGEVGSRHDSAASLSPQQSGNGGAETHPNTAGSAAAIPARNLHEQNGEDTNPDIEANTDEENPNPAMNTNNDDDDEHPTKPLDSDPSDPDSPPPIPPPIPPTAFAPLPQKNKAGHPLRWSLSSLPPPSTTPGRAEAALVVFKRLAGESHAARRRRVRREVRLLGGWGLESGGM